MNLSQLEVLVAIATTGSLKEASYAVNLTQSAVSYSLSKLENELGIQLVERGRNGATVTDIGEKVVKYAQSALGDIERIRQVTIDARGIQSIKIRLGCVPHTPARLINGITQDLRYQYPQIEILPFEGTPNELISWLNKGLIDVAMMTDHDAVTNRVAIIDDDLKLVVSSDHSLANEHEVEIHNIVDELFIGPESEFKRINQMLIARDIKPFKMLHHVNTYPTIFSMIREQVGISVMPQSLINSQHNDLISINLNPKIVLHVELVSLANTPHISALMTYANRWARTHGFLTSVM